MLNEESEWSGELNVEENEGSCKKVLVKAVVEVLHFMKAEKAARASGVCNI